MTVFWSVVLGVILIGLTVGWFYLCIRVLIMGVVILQGLWRLEKQHPGIVTRSVPHPQPSPLPWLGVGFLLGRRWHR